MKKGKAFHLPFLFLLLAVVLSFFAPYPSSAQIPESLQVITVASFEDPAITTDFIANRVAAIQLGKALFWDMQVGSDGLTACASCHFSAGADSRIKSQLNPGVLAGDNLFGNNPTTGGTDFPQFGPNYTLQIGDFPLHERVAQDSQQAAVLRDTNDVISSQGVMLTDFVDVVPGQAADITTPAADPVFNVGGVNVRRVEPRNTPTVINAVFNLHNFWDGRAGRFFNGVNPFGELDPNAGVYTSVGGVLTKQTIRIRNASLASQAVGPPLSEFEMSARGRTFPKIGKKLLDAKPLAQQQVAITDSVLGGARDSATGKGLNTTYRQLIQTAFQSQWWSNTTAKLVPDAAGTLVITPGQPVNTNEFTQMEANFSLFFGLAIQLYESTLVAAQTRFDSLALGDATALTAEEQRGLNTFLGKGNCIFCHPGTVLAGGSLPEILGLEPPVLPNPVVLVTEFMNMAAGASLYDIGYYNAGVRPTAEDIGRGGNSPFDNSLVPGTKLPLSFTRNSLLERDAQLPAHVATFAYDLAPNVPPGFSRTAVNGAVRAPGLRNVELTGPYFRNGGVATLKHVVEFYSRGGNFPALNIDNLDPLILELKFTPTEEEELVAFLKSLTDERVRNMSAPFDHPELIVPNGLDANGNEEFLAIPAVGAGGRSAFGLPPLQAFPFPPDVAAIVTPPGGGGGGGTTPTPIAGGGGGGGCFIATVTSK